MLYKYLEFFRNDLYAKFGNLRLHTPLKASYLLIFIFYSSLYFRRRRDDEVVRPRSGPTPKASDDEVVF